VSLVSTFTTTFTTTFIRAMFTHILSLVVATVSHLTAFFTSSAFRTEVLSTVVIAVSRVRTIFTITEGMDLCDLVPAEFRREFPLPHFYPVAPICGSPIPTTAPEDEVDAVEVEHVVGDADRNSEAQLRRIQEVGWLGDNHSRSSHIDTETNVSRLSH